MSSGTPKYPDAFRVGVQQANKSIERIMRQGLSPRQQDLNRLWAYYCAEQYDACKIGWNGKEIQDDLQHESISRTGVMPPGFYNASAFDEMPLEYRRARAPYHLVRVVVNRFTSLLFSERRRPKIKVEGAPDGDPDAQTFIENLIKASRFWVRLSQARKYGGGIGSVGVTFRFTNGTPVIEVHDPRWCTPFFKDRATGELEGLEIRFMYPEEIRNPETGVLEEVWFWYRRTIDETEDVTYVPAPVGEGDEPIWEVETATVHQLSEFPGVWIRNTETDAVDGEPDCHGVFDTSDEIDMLISQASQGALENCDPTLHIADDSEANEGIKKGSRNAIKTSVNGKIVYVEMTGAGVETALKVAERLRRDALEVTQCILDNDQIAGPAMTATEIERRQESMFDRGDAFREQYGQTGAKPLLEKMIRAIVKLGSGLQVAGEIRRATFAVPGNLQAIANRDVATPLSISLDWPPWVTRGPTDAQAAAGAASIAVAGQILSKQKALEYIATYFGIDDTAEAMGQLNAESQAANDAMTQNLIDASRAPGAETPPANNNPAAASHPTPPPPLPTPHPPAPPHLPPVSGS